MATQLVSRREILSFFQRQSEVLHDRKIFLHLVIIGERRDRCVDIIVLEDPRM